MQFARVELVSHKQTAVGILVLFVRAVLLLQRTALIFLLSGVRLRSYCFYYHFIPFDNQVRP